MSVFQIRLLGFPVWRLVVASVILAFLMVLEWAPRVEITDDEIDRTSSAPSSHKDATERSRRGRFADAASVPSSGPGDATSSVIRPKPKAVPKKSKKTAVNNDVATKCPAVSDHSTASQDQSTMACTIALTAGLVLGWIACKFFGGAPAARSTSAASCQTESGDVSWTTDRGQNCSPLPDRIDAAASPLATAMATTSCDAAVAACDSDAFGDVHLSPEDSMSSPVMSTDTPTTGAPASAQFSRRPLSMSSTLVQDVPTALETPLKKLADFEKALADATSSIHSHQGKLEMIVQDACRELRDSLPKLDSSVRGANERGPASPFTDEVATFLVATIEPAALHIRGLIADLEETFRCAIRDVGDLEMATIAHSNEAIAAAQNEAELSATRRAATPERVSIRLGVTEGPLAVADDEWTRLLLDAKRARATVAATGGQDSESWAALRTAIQAAAARAFEEREGRLGEVCQLATEIPVIMSVVDATPARARISVERERLNRLVAELLAASSGLGGSLTLGTSSTNISWSASFATPSLSALPPASPTSGERVTRRIFDQDDLSVIPQSTPPAAQAIAPVVVPILPSSPPPRPKVMANFIDASANVGRPKPADHEGASGVTMTSQVAAPAPPPQAESSDTASNPMHSARSMSEAATNTDDGNGSEDNDDRFAATYSFPSAAAAVAEEPAPPSQQTSYLVTSVASQLRALRQSPVFKALHKDSKHSPFVRVFLEIESKSSHLLPQQRNGVSSLPQRTQSSGALLSGRKKTTTAMSNSSFASAGLSARSDSTITPPKQSFHRTQTSPCTDGRPRSQTDGSPAYGTRSSQASSSIRADNNTPVTKSRSGWR